MEVIVIMVLIAAAWLILKFLSSGLEKPNGHNFDPRELHWIREEAIKILCSSSDSSSKINAVITLRKKATLGLLDSWADEIFAALNDQDSQVSVECARLIDKCVDHGIRASDGISTVAMMPEDAQQLKQRIDEALAILSDSKVNSILRYTRQKLTDFIQRKRN